ncbi:MAG: hypothetical protein E6I22_01570 [Chloroflexi bacterium]|nr:MAG: hypothetical protein E6I22_01570 [Chloroflexota bacterium]
MSQSLVGVVVALGALLVIWYLVGNEVMRRRGRTLAVWCKRALDPLGGRQAIQWITTHSFRLEVQGLKPPFTEGSLTGLAESWDVPMIWAINRINGRRDMVLLQLGCGRPGTLDRKPSKFIPPGVGRWGASAPPS